MKRREQNRKEKRLTEYRGRNLMKGKIGKKKEMSEIGKKTKWGKKQTNKRKKAELKERLTEEERKSVQGERLNERENRKKRK